MGFILYIEKCGSDYGFTFCARYDDVLLNPQSIHLSTSINTPTPSVRDCPLRSLICGFRFTSGFYNHEDPHGRFLTVLLIEDTQHLL